MPLLRLIVSSAFLLAIPFSLALLSPTMMARSTGFMVWHPCPNTSSQNQDGVSLAPFLHAIQDKVIVDTWNHLKDAVLEGDCHLKGPMEWMRLIMWGRMPGFARFSGPPSGTTTQFL
ncbi:hypothetical protein CK203_072171 [Vitis vinifera]|uniref:Uncharacterized protein n=1 Tax=Vitis vinifera TaxID=29760 RepID=A0A438BVB5_VITVI|nr:hypothetical protein CK203_072171 [Vitis vinifera]